MQIIDLTKPIQYNQSDPWFMKVRIKHKPHRRARWLIRFLGLPFRLFPKDFVGWADDTIKKMGVHATTHLDAPWHYAPLSEGKRAKTIDEIPLDWCFGDGLVIDMKHKPDFEEITVADLEGFLAAQSLVLRQGMIVLIKTGRDKLNGTKQFPYVGTGMSRAATEWLIDRGIKVMGIDSWGGTCRCLTRSKKRKKPATPNCFGRRTWWAAPGNTAIWNNSSTWMRCPTAVLK
jgi:hypothetical protein